MIGSCGSPGRWTPGRYLDARRLVASVLLCVALVTLGSISPARAQNDRPPLSTFFAGEAIRSVKLSPSGKHLAIASADKNGRVFLAVTNADMSDRFQIVASAPFADIQEFEWVDDDWLVFNLIDLKSAAYDQKFGPGLFSVRRDGTQTRLLIQAQAGDRMTTGTNIGSNRLAWNHGLLTVLRDGSHDVIVGAYVFSPLGDIDTVVPKRLDVVTGRVTDIARNAPVHAMSWVFDRAGVARAVTTERDGGAEVFWRDSEASPWRSLQKAKLFEMPWWPRAVDASGRLYVLATAASSTVVMKRIDFANGQPEHEPIAAAPGFDLTGDLVFTQDGSHVSGVRVVTDAETTVWFDPAVKKLQALADARFPGRVNRLACEDCMGEGALLVESFADHDPGSWSVYRPKTGAWTAIGSARPAVDPRQMADLDLHRIKARDGLEIPVWVTRSKAAKGASPAVVLVHGGPWVRGVRWEWDAEAQFLASRGYTVIEPEFRGSKGYGENLFRAGWKQWGTTMQDDLADAVAWAAGEKLIDPARVCIAGASYGGYAALMAPIRHPGLFKCSIAQVAVADPRLMFADTWNGDIDMQDIRFTLPTLIGDPVTDADLLKAASPIERAAELKIPLLLAYGREDQRVPIEHGFGMRAALKAAGHPPEFVVYEDEGHGFLKPGNRLDFYGRVEKFLDAHLGVDTGSRP